MKKILVVGGTGFIGYHVIKEAKKRKWNVTSISLGKPKRKRFHKNVNYKKIDITDYNSLKKKISSNYDFVVNVGGYGKHPDFGKEGFKLFKSHFYGLINILNVLSLKKIKKFIQIGSSAEYGKSLSPLKEHINCRPKTPYSIAKLACTNLLLNLYQKQKFPVTILRLFQVYGPDQDNNRILPFLINNCLRNRNFKTTSGKQTCDFCYIDDVVRAIFKSLKSKKSNGDVINIGLGEPVQIKEIILIVKKLIGKGNPIFGALKYKRETNMRNYPSIYKAKKKLNWKPKIKLIYGIKKTIKNYI